MGMLSALRGLLRRRPARRAWEAAKQTRLYTVSTSPRPIDTDLRAGLRALVSRARHEAQNNDYVRQFLRLARTNIVGHQGIVLQARSIGRGGTPDEPANAAIERAWQDWGRHGVPEVTGVHSWRSLQRLFVDQLMRDGEVLVAHRRNWDGNPYRYALQLIDPLALDPDLNRDLGNGRVIRMGVELDDLRRPVAYHLLAGSSVAEAYVWMGRRYERISASEMLHRFLPEWVWQTRGVPPMSASLQRLNMLSGYQDAELTAARAGAAKMGFYVSPDGAGPQVDATVDAAGHGDFIEEAEPGTFGVLPEGYDFRPWDPQHPNTAYGDFVKDMLRGLAGGLGVSYNSLANDLEGVNFSSLRQGAIEERAVWMLLQDCLIDAVLEPIYRAWLTSALLAGAITVSGKPLKPELEEKYRRVSWQPRRWPWVDPLKEAQANELAIKLRAKSISEVIRDQGRDPEDVWQEIARERQRLAQLGIPYDEAASAASSASGGGNDAP